MKNVTINISFVAENESDYAFANSIVNALKVRSGAKVKVQEKEPTAAPAAPAAPATPAAPVPAQAQAQTPATVPAPAAAASEAKYTCEDARKAMAAKLANHRTVLVDKLRSLGAKNISTLPQEKYPEFIDFCNSLD